MSVEFHRLAIADVRRETPDAVSMCFNVPDRLQAAYRFIPGQHVTVRTVLDGVEIRRSYSICSALDENELRVAVKKVEHGLFSSLLHDRLRVGDALEVMTPQGRFGINPDPGASRSYLAIAAGSGITPIRSIIRSVLTVERSSRVALLYGNRTAQSIIFKEALEDLKDRYLAQFELFHVLSRDRQELELLNGRIDAEKIERVLKTLSPAGDIDAAFLCGPGTLISASRQTLTKLGVQPARIHSEYFSVDGVPIDRAPSSPRASRPPVAVAVIKLNGIEHEVPVFSGDTIVEAGLRHGLDMPFSCRGGMCCTCRAKLTEGKVEMARNYSLEPWELSAGYVLTCQSQPRASRVALDFDQL